MTARCVKCGREFEVESAPDCDPEVAAMLARFLTCEHCLNPKRPPEREVVGCVRGCPKEQD